MRCPKLDEKGEAAEENPYQRLQLSRDLNKLMEVFGDSKCNIFTKQKDIHKKQVEWTLTHQIKKYPTPLQGLTNANFLFSPNFNYFIDVAVRLG